MAQAEKGLRDLLLHGLKDIYYAEGKIEKALTKMSSAAQDGQLAEALEEHQRETAGQIERLEQIFEAMGEKAKGEKCEAIEGILAEGDSLLKDFGKTAAGDAAIIFSCQAVEHYEIARYGSLRAYAELLELDEVVSLLDQTLDEEESADEKLSDIAESTANPAAAEAMGDADGDDEE